MRLLLDTQIVYWFYYEPDKLSREARELMVKSDENFVSAATIWEMAIKAKLGKLKADPKAIATTLVEAGFTELPVSAKHSASVVELPLHHRDPFDRLLVAQAISEPMFLLTADRRLPIYNSDLVLLV